MHINQLKIGLNVKINSNIEKTHQLLNSNLDMDRMAGNGEVYKITDVRKHMDDTGERVVVAEVNQYIWMPEDLSDAEEGFNEPISLAGKKQTFDPCEL